MIHWVGGAQVEEVIKSNISEGKKKSVKLLQYFFHAFKKWVCSNLCCLCALIIQTCVNSDLCT